MMFMCAHVYDVALCSNTVRNVALGLWLVGHSWFRGFEQYPWKVMTGQSTSHNCDFTVLNGFLKSILPHKSMWRF